MSGKRKAAGAASSSGGAATKARGRTAKKKRGLLARLAIWTAGLTALLVLVGAVAFVVLYTTTDVPDPNADFQTETTFVYYRNGDSELGEFATQNRDSIDLADMPDDLKDAVVAAENRTFWTDNGIDPRGILRAAFSNAQGNATQGASTITQQYVKILYLSQDQTLSRKAKEALLSLKIQRQQSKEEILEGYLNTIYFGRGAYGVEAASEAWFDIPAKDLSLRQSAFLASVLNSPSNLDPTAGRDNKRELRERYRYTLDGMVEMGTASRTEADTAAKSLPDVPEQEAESQYGGQRGHMLELVRSELNGLGFSDSEIDGGGLRVTTTFDRQVMDAAAAGVEAQRPEGFSDKDLHIGVASVEPGTGALRGMYGGQDYLDSQLNWARSGGQAGSTMKAFAVAEGIDQGFALTDVFEGNSPYVLPDGSGDVENQGNTSYGSSITLEQATEDSVNTAFIDLTLGMNNGPESIIERANAMGIPPDQAPARKRDRFGIPNESPGLEPVTGVALGNATVSPINMANGYATIAAEGQAAEVHVVERVEDADGNELYQREGSTEEALPADVAADTSYALQQVVQSGSGTAALSLGRPAAGKTGTATNGDGEVSSSWFVGYTPQLSTAVMYVRGQGNEELEGWLPEYFGGSYPARTWTDVMGRALDGTDVLDFPDPVFLDGDAPDSSAEVPTEAPETEAPAPEPEPQPQPQPEPEPEQPTEEPTIEEPEPQPEPSQPPETDDPETEDPGPGLPSGGPSGGPSGAPTRDPGREPGDG